MLSFIFSNSSFPYFWPSPYPYASGCQRSMCSACIRKVAPGYIGKNNGFVHRQIYLDAELTLKVGDSSLCGAFYKDGYPWQGYPLVVLHNTFKRKLL